jgi:hypothetical protein
MEAISFRERECEDAGIQDIILAPGVFLITEPS